MVEWFQFAFWCSVGFVFYAYLGYPLLLWALSCWRSHDVLRRDVRPSVTFIITAYNEERRIEEKLKNTMSLTYPAEHLEILVASDCSSDRTDDIVRSFAPGRIHLVRSPVRKGKEAAQKLAVQAAHGEILVFSDSATILPQDAIINIVRNFADPSVGCVSSIDRFVDKDGMLSGEGAYVRYEMWLRSLESRVYSLVGLSGSFFAARRKLCRDWATDLQSDFNTLLNSIKLHQRGVLDPLSIGYYQNISDERKEFERKARTVVRGISVLMKNLSLLNPFQYGIFAWQLFSHKLCRWLVPFALCSALVSNVFLVGHWDGYLVSFFMQVSMYASTLAWFTLGQRARSLALLKVPSFFVLANASIMVAWFRYLKGERITLWNPSSRS